MSVKLMATSLYRSVSMALAVSLLTASFSPAETPYKYFRSGSSTDLVAAPTPGYALMGGGKDLDEAFQWLCERAHGGDFLILRAAGDDDYNPYVQKLCKLNSVATLILPSRAAAANSNVPFVLETIEHAEAIFIAGGDQANYIRFWTGTPVQAAVNAAILRGVPIGGTSAGLAVLGEWAYSAEGDKPDDPNLSGKMALADPNSARVTLAHGFLQIPALKGIITDTHFAKRDRMGRLLVFLSRINATEPEKSGQPPVRGIGVEQGAALLVESDGRGQVVGTGSAYFVEEASAAKGSMSLTGFKANVRKVSTGREFNLKSWSGDGSRYDLTVEGAKLISSQTGGAVY